MKSGTVRIYFLSEFAVCCHRNILLPWERDVTTSPLYCKSVTLTSFARHNIGKKVFKLLLQLSNVQFKSSSAYQDVSSDTQKNFLSSIY